MWQREILKKFPYMEIVSSDRGRIEIYLPQEPNEEVKNVIRQIIPDDVDYGFVVGLKPSTIDQLKFLIIQSGLGLVIFKVFKTGHVHLQMIALQDDPDESHPIWSDLAAVLYKDGFPDTWEIAIGKTKRTWYRKVMDEIRTAVEPITTDDILNLKIILNTTQDVNDFLTQLK